MRLDAYNSRQNQGRGRRRFAVVALAGIIGLGGLVSFRTGGKPDVNLAIEMPAIGPQTPFSVSAKVPRRGLTQIVVRVKQSDASLVIYEKTFEARPAWAFWGPMTKEVSADLTLVRANIPDVRGKELTIEVEARSVGTLVFESPTAFVTKTLPIRLSPPRISSLSNNIFAGQGGAEVVVYVVAPTAIKHGVQAGNWFFPGYPLPGGSKGEFFSLFGVPYDMSDGDENIRLVAEDDVGNVASVQFLDQFIKRPFKTDTIEVSDRFMGLVVPRILAKTPELEDKGSLLENYVSINSDLREKNAETLLKLSEETAEKFLWTKSFVQMPAKVVSSFADRRTYKYKGKKIDQQDHLGFDLASVRHDKIPAANTGTVIFADYLGIYGNTVVIDHGYGLQSLYSHMSKISVEVGDTVERAQTIGRTGATGLALGDHLHFTLMIRGLPVTPLEWWDGHWIHDRIALKLGDAFKYERRRGSK